ncbi:hypothetical protein D3C76_1681790 [compost metagenome]
MLPTVIPLAAVDSISAFSRFVNSNGWKSVKTYIPSPTPDTFPPFVTPSIRFPLTVTVGVVVELVILTPSGIM